jgi:hypothetical protein
MEKQLNPDMAVHCLRIGSVPVTSKAVTLGMPVYVTAGAQVGRVAGIVVDAETHQAGHLALDRKGLRASEPALVPVDLVDFVIRHEVCLRISQDQIFGLTVYQTEVPETA